MTAETPETIKARVHILKCWPESFRAIKAGTKRHEVRKDDRGYMVGDLLDLREFEPTPSARQMHTGEWYTPNGDYMCNGGRFTGEKLWLRVTYKTTGGSRGLPTDVCVLSIEVCDVAPPRAGTERR